MGTAIHDVLILDAQQVALGDHDIDVPHQAGDTVQEWKSRMLTTVAYGKRVRCNDGVDSDKAT